MDLVRFKYRILGFMRKTEKLPALADLPVLGDLGGALLDAGCGQGRNFERLGEAAGRFRPLGIDVSLSNLAAAAAKGTPGRFVAADALAMPFRDGSFDVVLSDRVIEHTHRYRDMLREIHRVLRPGGTLLLATPNIDRPTNLFVKHVLRRKPMLRWENWHGLDERRFRGHVQEFTEEEIVGHLVGAGFAVEKVTGDYPSLSREGNLVWMTYRALEYLFWLLLRVAGKKSSKNIYILARR